MPVHPSKSGLRSICWLFLAACLLINPLIVSANDERPPVRIALLTSSVHDQYLDGFINQTIRSIQEHLKDYKVILTPYTDESLRKALNENKVDFTISDSFFYLSASASARAQGLGRLASMQVMESKQPIGQIGGVIIRLKKSSEDVDNLSSLKGKSIAIPAEEDYYGWGALQREIHDAGYSPKTFFSRKVVTNSSLDETVQSVLDGTTDLGVIHTCYLENRKDDPRLQLLEVVAPRDVSGFNCQSSTRLYLGWVLAATPRNNTDITREIVSALLSVKDPGGSNWAFGEDFSQNHSLFDVLDVYQYSEFHRFAWDRFLKENLNWFFLVFIIAAGLLFHSIRSNHLVEVRTRDLRKAQKERTDLLDKLYNMQKVGVIGLMSSLLAHELRQPIGALRNYLQGLKIQLKLGSVTKDSLEEAVKERESQMLRANSIVEKVRGYAKDKESKTTSINLITLVKQQLETLRKTRDQFPKIDLNASNSSIYIEGNKTEIELAFLNVLKNAIEACQNEKDPSVQINIFQEGDRVRMEVIDNGPTLSEEDFHNLGTPLITTKSDGLGLGFPIANRIAEAHGGKLEFKQLPDGPLCVSIQLPIKRGNKNSPKT